MAKRAVPLRNWLKELDEEVSRSPEPEAGQRYSLFYFARYGKREYLTIPDEVFRNQLTFWRNRLSEESRVVDRLNAQQLDQLAALMHDIMYQLEVYFAPKSKAERPSWQRTGLKYKPPRMRKIANEARRRRKMLVSKLIQARRAVKQFGDYAQKLDPMHGTLDYINAAKSCLKILEKLSTDTSVDFEVSLKDEYPVVPDPTAFCMVRLYWLFRHGCCLSGDEAEVRVAMIRNAFWTQYGVQDVSYRPNYSDAESAGCGAVAEAVRRFH